MLLMNRFFITTLTFATLICCGSLQNTTRISIQNNSQFKSYVNLKVILDDVILFSGKVSNTLDKKKVDLNCFILIGRHELTIVDSDSQSSYTTNFIAPGDGNILSSTIMHWRKSIQIHKKT